MKPVGVFLLFLLVAVSPVSADDALVSIGDIPYLTQDNPGGKITYLRYPTLGCPALVVRGTTGQAWVRLPNGGSTTDFQLSISSNGDARPQTFPLAVQSIAYDPLVGIYKVTYRVPENAPEDMYDLTLVIPSQSISDRQFNSFKVMRENAKNFTFAVLADSQFNDPRGIFSPGNYNKEKYNTRSIVEQIKKELRALQPAFVIYCGDLLFGLNYEYEYQGAWDVWKDAGVPIFMVPGNHDGYASIRSRTVLGIRQPVRDGLKDWRKMIGPNYFSFDWGGLHFQGVNSYDGTPERRDSFLIVIENYGGDLMPAQMDWIAWDLAGTGRTAVPFMHHCPLATYRPNGTFGSVWGWALTRILRFVTTGNSKDMDQRWNSQSTAEFLKAQYLTRAPLVFVGHDHFDNIEPYQSTTYKVVTTAASSGKGYWGYTMARVEDSRIADYLYLNNSTFQSIPAGNLQVTYEKKKGGETPSTASAEIRSGLSRSYDVTLEFVVRDAPAYTAQNGTVTASSRLEDGTTKVWVRSAAPKAESIETPVSTQVTVQPGTAVGGSLQVQNRGSKGGSCGGAPTSRDALGQLLILAATLLALAAARARA